LPAANAQNAQRYLAVCALAWIAVLASLALSRPARDVGASYLAVIVLSLLLCIACASALIVGVYRRSQAMRAAGASFDGVSAASRRYSNLNAVGSLVMFAGALVQATRAFGVPEFAGQWLITMLCFGAGLLVQLYSQAKYLQALG
jgi:hypothetical protein